MRTLAVSAFLVLVLVVAFNVGIAMLLLRGGISARTEPSRLEAMLARPVQKFLLREARNRMNPVPLSSEVLTEARGHFADHCASCHGNDGSGRTELGAHLYPRVPDMRLAFTQDLSDGELFSIIEDGVRFTGMPGWGDGRDQGRASWKLVHFIRRLPQLTADEIAKMRALNPRTPEEWREQQEEEQFLEGDEPAPAKSHRH